MDIVIVINKKSAFFAEWYYSLIVLIISRNKPIHTLHSNNAFCSLFSSPTICMIWTSLPLWVILKVFVSLFYFLVFKTFLIIQLAWKKMSYFISLKKGNGACWVETKSLSNLPLCALMSAFFKKTSISKK